MTPKIKAALDSLAALDSSEGDSIHNRIYARVVAAIDAEFSRRHAEHINDVAIGERRLIACEKERDEARSALNARGLSCCPDLDLMHWVKKATAAETDRDQALDDLETAKEYAEAIRDCETDGGCGGCVRCLTKARDDLADLVTAREQEAASLRTEKMAADAMYGDALRERYEAQKDLADWKQIASDNGEIVDAARNELARWEKLDSLTNHDAFLMREAFHRALMG